MKRVELKEGKFCLEGRIVEAEIINVRTVNYLAYKWNAIIHLRSEEKWKETEKFNEAKRLDTIKETKPNEANAYFNGEGIVTDFSYWYNQHFLPIVYLKIKDVKSE